MDLKEFLKAQNWSQQFLAEKLNEDAQLYGLPKTATQGAVSQWLQSRIPADRLPQLERISDGELKPEVLRPDLYPHRGAAA